jgi:hypothetical protein
MRCNDESRLGEEPCLFGNAAAIHADGLESIARRMRGTLILVGEAAAARIAAPDEEPSRWRTRGRLEVEAAAECQHGPIDRTLASSAILEVRDKARTASDSTRSALMPARANVSK